ncbi:MAG: indole-3-glycerol phosphate synthase TrpC [Tannerellaceae bacterium]|jgi:indole-3-glycerol phosphate synthase|nr:indole-3-glycerol phosphate synthase TrpC [Tannerellaceae bacterium]
MKDILHEIIRNKRIEVSRQKQAVDLRTLLTTGNDSLERKTCSMKTALAASASGIIAEFKRKSPSKGWLYPDAMIEDIVPQYEKNGAAACSILTDKDFFGGSLTDLQTARKLVNIPLLRKDFILDEYQIYQARIMGADAVLLIAAILTEEECLSLAKTARELSLETLLEIHSDTELSYLNPYIDMLGVNNRNLGTFRTDVENSFRLIEKMTLAAKATGVSPLLISESGISDTGTVKELRKAGFRGFLMGETFMKTKQPGESLLNFTGGLQ